MICALGVGSIDRHVDLQSSMLPLCTGCPRNAIMGNVMMMTVTVMATAVVVFMMVMIIMRMITMMVADKDADHNNGNDV